MEKLSGGFEYRGRIFSEQEERRWTEARQKLQVAFYLSGLQELSGVSPKKIFRNEAKEFDVLTWADATLTNVAHDEFEMQQAELKEAALTSVWKSLGLNVPVRHNKSLHGGHVAVESDMTEQRLDPAAHVLRGISSNDSDEKSMKSISIGSESNTVPLDDFAEVSDVSRSEVGDDREIEDMLDGMREPKISLKF